MRIINDFRQITKNFDEVVVLASAPRPAQPYRILLDHDEDSSYFAKNFYDQHYVVDNLKSGDPDYSTSHLTSDTLHVIVAAFQNQPLSMEFYAMKKVLADNLELKDLPEGLKLKAEEESSFLILLKTKPK